ncbi:MAG: hypothetical protein U0744_15635 [Gemmataceae bacterium]
MEWKQLAILEVSEGGPWTAGGPSTVKGLRPGILPYVGPEGQFGRHHPRSAHGLFADGSVHAIPLDAPCCFAGGHVVTLGRKRAD